jgi:hypothetical protein
MLLLMWRLRQHPFRLRNIDMFMDKLWIYKMNFIFITDLCLGTKGWRHH